MKRLITVGTISQEIGCPIWQVQYLLQSRHISPTQRAGHLRIYSEEVIEILRNELAAVRDRKARQVCTA
ncbi:MAG: hypothetical protein ABH852_01935 [Methanobacteriota archaeon]